MTTLIAAVGENGGIGLNGHLPWTGLRGELRWFRRATEGRTLLMGRRTAEGLPSALPGRQIVVVSSAPFPGRETYPDPDSALAAHPDAWVAGGAALYAATLPRADRMLLTRVRGQYEADTFFPTLPETGWELRRLPDEGDEGWHVEEWIRIAAK